MLVTAAHGLIRVEIDGQSHRPVFPKLGERWASIIRFGVNRPARRRGVYRLIVRGATPVSANVLMRQFPDRAQERQRHFAGAVVLQLLLVPIAAVDYLEQEVIGGVLRRPACALVRASTRGRSWPIFISSSSVTPRMSR